MTISKEQLKELFDKKTAALKALNTFCAVINHDDFDHAVEYRRLMIAASDADRAFDKATDEYLAAQ